MRRPDGRVSNETDMKGKQRLVQLLLALLFCAVGALLVLLPSIRVAIKSYLSEPSSRERSRSSGQLSIESVLDALETVQDPEISMSIVDLGLVRDVDLRSGRVEVEIVLTSPYCPLADVIVADIEDRLKQLEGVKEVEVRIDESAVWSWEMMSERGKRRLERMMR
jgi:metal-sulfur cluster biosynthetic enzyme